MSIIGLLWRTALSFALLYGGFYFGAAAVPLLIHGGEHDRGIAESYARMVPVTGRVIAATWTPIGGKPLGHLRTTFEYTPAGGATMRDEVDDTLRSSDSHRYVAGGPIALYYDPHAPKFVRTAQAYGRNQEHPGSVHTRWLGVGFGVIALILLLIGGALTRGVLRRARAYATPPANG